MQSEADLARRLSPWDRRVFALVSRTGAMPPQEPLALLHAALGAGPEPFYRIEEILGAPDKPLPSPPLSATFYSVSATNPGLAG